MPPITMSSVAQSPRNLICRFCDRKYSKAEHLARHERSHTGSKPFLCVECDRQFSRQDSLARHAKLHLRHESSRAPARASSLTAPSMFTSASFDAPAMNTGHGSSNTDRFGGDLMRDTVNETIEFSEMPTSLPGTSLDLEQRLVWPDSEDLLQVIMSDMSAWPTSLPILPPSLNTSEAPEGIAAPFGAALPSERPTENGQQAVQSLSQLITTLSSNVTAEVESTGVTSVFLDKCLHMFFTHFNPTFPVLHRPTFVFKDCTHPLLLNAIALGSLFLGPRDAIAKGEALWRLAHIAVATSWPSLMTHRGPYDACNGVQLVLTALLGQFYATLSKNKSLRTTSQIFHGLGFYWARHCGMYETAEFSFRDIPDFGAPAADKIQKWRTWASQEIQLRSILGHYILDGQIASYSGDATCVRHGNNPLRLPSKEDAFLAGTVDDWISAMKTPEDLTSFREIFNSLFSPSNDLSLVDQTSSYLAVQVLLEGLNSLSQEFNEAGGPAVGIPSRDDINRALEMLYSSLMRNQQLSAVETSEALLRWHVICLDAAINSATLCRHVCHHYNIEQHVFGGAKKASREFDVLSWINSAGARRAILHAVAIHEIAEKLPLGRAHGIYIPGSIFAAAMVYSAFSLAGIPTVVIPQKVDWHDALASDLELYSDRSMQASLKSDTTEFLCGEYRPSNHDRLTRNLGYDLNSLQNLLRCLSHQWGVSFEMVSVLDELVSSST